MFIATANMLDTIPAPLRDRMEIIDLAGYTDEDKLNIARRFLMPKQMKANGSDGPEADLDRRGAAADHPALHARSRRPQPRARDRHGLPQDRDQGCGRRGSARQVIDRAVREYLGRPRFFYEELAARTSQPGVAIGVGVTGVGGDIMFLEATRMPGKGSLQVTGQLGDVMKESAHAALSFVRSRASDLKIDPEFFQNSDIHIHVPAGAVPKDGPSAGVAMTTAIISLLTGTPVLDDVAMTGEITLRGQVLPVGGIKEKSLAASRAGLTRFVLPYRNEVDLDDVPEELKEKMTFIPAKTMDDVLEAVMPPKFNKNRKPLLTSGKPAKASRSERVGCCRPLARISRAGGVRLSGASSFLGWFDFDIGRFQILRIRPEPDFLNLSVMDPECERCAHGSAMRPYGSRISIDPGDASSMCLADELASNLDAPVDFGLNTHLRGRVVGAQHRIRRQQRNQPIQVPALRSREEGLDDCPMRLTRRGSGELSYGDFQASAAGELAGRLGRAFDDGRNLIERQPEEIVQHEGGRFERREAVERVRQGFVDGLFKDDGGFRGTVD